MNAYQFNSRLHGNGQTIEISSSLWISFRNFFVRVFMVPLFLGLAFLLLSACVYAWIFLLVLWFYWLPYSCAFSFGVLLFFCVCFCFVFVAFVFITSQFYRKETYIWRRYMDLLCCGAAVASASVEFKMEWQSDRYLPKRNTSAMGTWTSSRVVDQTMTACVRIRIIFLAKSCINLLAKYSCKKCRIGVVLLPMGEKKKYCARHCFSFYGWMRHAVTVCTHASRLPSIIINKVVRSMTFRSIIMFSGIASDKARTFLEFALSARWDCVGCVCIYCFGLWGNWMHEAVSGRFSTSVTLNLYMPTVAQNLIHRKRNYFVFFSRRSFVFVLSTIGWPSCAFMRVWRNGAPATLVYVCLLFYLYVVIGIYGGNQSSEQPLGN